MKAFLCFAFTAALLTGAHAQTFKPGTLELAGSGDLGMNIDANSNKFYFMDFNPELSIYVTPNLYFGPIVSLGRRWANSPFEYSATSIGAGPNGGVLIDLNAMVFPYLGLSGLYFRAMETGGFISNPSDYMTELRAYAGLKVALSKSFFLNLQPTFKLDKPENEPAVKTFIVLLGFSGKIGD